MNINERKVLEAEHIFLGLLLETKLHGKTSNITTED
jgi:hypothetical protein